MFEFMVKALLKNYPPFLYNAPMVEELEHTEFIMYGLVWNV